MPQGNPFRMRALASLLGRIYALGLVPTCDSLKLCNFVMASSSCRCLLTVQLKLCMAQHLQANVAFVEQGHVHGVPDVVT